MFSSYGRRDYDEDRIRNSQTLLHVLGHAGIHTLWRDNQSGCKGVCDDTPTEITKRAKHPAFCASGQCFDEILVEGLEEKLAGHGDMVIVLHQLGSHGPAYFLRYPDAFRRFEPACESSSFADCTQQEIINAYDNSLLYTDHVLARAIDLLNTQTTHDAALLYVSDHGESLGERGVYLHGMPWMIAPAEQIEIPMTMWLSSGFAASRQIDAGCLAARSQSPLDHDYLFHTVLGLFDVHTEAYRPDLDFAAGCRGNVS